LIAGANVASQLGWRGHYIDPTGFYYMGARYYAPDSGTFLSPDPLGHSASMDLYSYCDGDPVNQYDADGRIGKGLATGVALGGFGQYENSTQQIAGLVGQVGSYFIPGMQGYSTARDITFSGYSASKAAYNIGKNGANLSNVSELAMSASELIPGGRAVGTALRGESSAVFQELRQTINVGAARGVAPETRALSEANLTGSGRTVLGHYPEYIQKAQRTGSSYFDIGDAWNTLTPAQRTSANMHFLDEVAGAGDQIYLSLPKSEIRRGSALADEIQYLTGEKGYQWINQWSLRPSGN
jgi:RHS repeat-associated protein